ncbi:predicted protein [Sclerotinia sclerotiorum 1980 UF-70]|uniref:Uncharacterized protein n=1 Tax=Sclerotinia sclerotiorum (strain ATCC 18683 / 1980 / Ss-1) TaxID=665079 RepID=A7EP89_SCLS1|nr:predicted protein [Sclerotinia sclerotiorum 1980 UF-70]EDO04655.1 predicted protein [Sclerotinia sclerotiorum 1980 UF-70]
MDTSARESRRSLVCRPAAEGSLALPQKCRYLLVFRDDFEPLRGTWVARCPANLSVLKLEDICLVALVQVFQNGDNVVKSFATTLDIFNSSLCF